MTPQASMRKIFLTEAALTDLQHWVDTDPKVVLKINKLLDSILEDPEHGIGKPEKLKYELSGLWSRRINSRDRIVYQIKGARIIVHQLRDHY